MEAGLVLDSGFPFFCALGFVARIAATGPFFLFPANSSAPGTAPRRLPEKQGERELFFVPGESLRSEVAPVACRETGSAGLFFCFRRIGPVPKHRPADGRSAGLRRNCPNSPQWFALRAESIRKTLSDCLETRCGEGVCYEIVKYI